MSNFIFLQDKWPELAKLGELAEKYLYTDSNTSFIKQGLLAENLVRYMLAYDGIEEPKPENTFVNCIKELNQNDLLPKEISDILYIIRTTRNKAAHTALESTEKAVENLRLTYELASWFMLTYGDYTYEPKTYHEPENVQQNIDELEKKSKELEDNYKKLEAECRATRSVQLIQHFIFNSRTTKKYSIFSMLQTLFNANNKLS